VTDGRASGPYDQVRAEKAVRELLLALGEDPDREGLKETPARVARAMKENFEGLWQSPEDVLTTTFDIGHEELVIVRDIEVFSHCEHHLTPFHGVAHVGYIPSGKITRLSKIARLVDLSSRRPQVHQRLTTQIADAMV
jgi:GTP cyclohydrolase I